MLLHPTRFLLLLSLSACAAVSVPPDTADRNPRPDEAPPRAGAHALPPAPAAQPPLADEVQLRAAENEPLTDTQRGWNRPFEPFTIIGNIHYVGTRGLGAYLITTPEGHFLLDGGLPQSGPDILDNIERLGFDVADVRILLNSHAHYDHAGGLARIQRASGARMIASAADAPFLESGLFPFGPTADMPFPPVHVDRVVADGETLTLGGVALTAHLTPGHSPGCTSWSMAVRGADGVPHQAFFHCSTTVAGQSLVPPAYPGVVEDYEQSFQRIEAMKADILLTNHGEFMDLEARRTRQLGGEADAFVDPAALRAHNARSKAAFERELERQRGGR